MVALCLQENLVAKPYNNKQTSLSEAVARFIHNI